MNPSEGDALHQHDNASEYGKPHKVITMATIAREAGVSQGAISSLLNDRDYGIRVSSKTRERVFKVCRELGYVPNDLRAVIRMYPERGDFCLLVSDEITDLASDPFISRVARGALKAMPEKERNITISQFKSHANYEVQHDQLPHPILYGIASKYVCIGTPNLSLVQAILHRGFPVISLGHDLALSGVTSLVPDYAAASRKAVDYLFQLGHKHIAILSGPFGATDPSIIELNRGVRFAYDDKNTQIEAHNIIYCDLTFQKGERSIEMLFARESRPTAIFGLNDIVAAGAIAGLRAEGLQVPDDVSVLGCSDDDLARHVTPALSTIHIPAEEMGESAVGQFENCLRDTSFGPAKKIEFPVRLIERDSCAPQKSA